MAEAGWYVDPMGTPNTLRYWNGVAWTNDTMPNPQQESPASSFQGSANQGAQVTQAKPQAQAQVQQPQAQPQAQASQQAQAQPQAQQQNYAGQTYPPQQPVNVSVNNFSQQPTNAGSAPSPMQPGQIYPMSESDRTLRLIAFIWNIVCTIACAVLIIPLAWMVPMTVHSYNIYRGTKPNTVGFGVCTLLFVGLVSGILLLCSKKD